MIGKTICVAIVAAGVGFAAPAFAGEGSPDISRSGPSYSYPSYESQVLAPAYPRGPAVTDRYYDDDDNVGYMPRRSRSDLNQEYDSRGFNSN